ncbi:MAG: hypothetical protein PHU80_12025, partial [Kiritimatiellae bacterium]|nr:hypothetical protein [Kiritimatiellia bacterium]
MNHMKLFVVSAIMTAFTFGAFGDEVIFKSGDRLTGTVKSVADGKMLFDSKVAGALTLKTEEIETFSTEAPIEIVK